MEVPDSVPRRGLRLRQAHLSKSPRRPIEDARPASVQGDPALRPWLSLEGVEDVVSFHVPLPQLVIFTAVAVIAGILAAVLPARRASRLNVLEALEYE